MKKSLLSFLWLFAALSSLLVSCSDGNGGDAAGIVCNVSLTATEGGSATFSDYLGSSMVVYGESEVTVIAVVDEGYEFDGWYNGNTKVSSDAEYTFTVSGDISIKAKFVMFVNGHECVDLGLPSGIKWATCNVGANTPEEYGGYYAWGETEEKTNYDWGTYKWSFAFSTSLTKYCTDSDFGSVDNKTVLDPEDDVAHVKWGGSWRMPTWAEQNELLTECTWTWTTLNGVKGYRVTGPNGNSIFLPAAGERYGAVLDYRGTSASYWSSSLNYYYSVTASYLYFYSDKYDWSDFMRYLGRSVRPVSK